MTTCAFPTSPLLRPVLRSLRAPRQAAWATAAPLRALHASPRRRDAAAQQQPPSPSSKTLEQILVEAIKVSGPLPVSSYMRTCLQDPERGYYATAADKSDGGRSVLGAKGDFVTSPEISQVFGELLAIYFITRWQAAGSPSRIRLVELGPGRGTLLGDLVRTFAAFAPVLSALSNIELLEVSPGLRQAQSAVLRDVFSRYAPGKNLVFAGEEGTDPTKDVSVSWADEVTHMAPAKDEGTFTMLVAHEFLDALPVRIFERTTQGFKEVFVGLAQDKKKGGVTTMTASSLLAEKNASSSTTSSSSPFALTLSPGSTPHAEVLTASSPRFKHLQPGQRVEISSDVWAASRAMAGIIGGAGEGVDRDGAAVIVDYGDERFFGGSWRGFKAHRIVDPLHEPGKVDQTANVDFAYVKEAVATTGAKSLGPLPQSTFLTSLGLAPRLEKLLTAANDAGRRKEIESAAKRLVDPRGMGGQYKVLALESRRRTERGEGEGEGQREGEKVYPFET